MRAVLLHLSDIHFASANDPVANRAGKIKDAILGKCPDVAACLVTVPGDIANTGAPEEYEVAITFFTELRGALQLAGIPQVEIVLVPGNHDCNLRRQNDTRTFIFESLHTFVKRSIDFNGANFLAIMGVQEDFFEFEAALRDRDMLPLSERLYFQRSFNVHGHTIIVHCFNTAWLSRRNEIQAELFLPEQVLTTEAPSDSSLTVAILHHPYNWLDATNARNVKRFLHEQVDIVLTGHEHVPGTTRRQESTGEQVDYCEAAALQDRETHTSGFQVVVLDFDRQEQEIALFTWNSQRYTEITSRQWSLARNSARPANPFKNNDVFLHELRSVGTGFRHPRCTPPNCQLVLRDIYIYPDLRHRDLEHILTGKPEKSHTINGDLVSDFILAKRRVLIRGQDDSGKSSLAKIHYEDIQARGYIPILLAGDRLKKRLTRETVMNTLRDVFAEQYSIEATEAYLQTDASKRALIIDDFHKAQLTRNNQKTILDLLIPLFSVVVVFASDLFGIGETATTTTRPFAAFEECDLKEFGKYHRHRLIERWQYLGREDTSEPEALNRHVILTDRTIATLLGKNVLPHYPVTILTLLQLMEANESTNTANGSYGYLYEVLIKTALASVGRGARDVDLKVTYISGIAFSMFQRKEHTLSASELRASHDAYCHRYDIALDLSRMVADLQQAEVLTEANGRYRFKYRYIFYYAVAKYLQDNASGLRPVLDDIADHIYNETNANTLIFYVYLTKDTSLIDRMVANAMRIFEEYEPCDLESHVSFVNQLYTQTPPPLQLEAGDVRSNRDAYNRRQDSAAELTAGNEDEQTEDYVYDRDLQYVIKFNIAFKTLQILGQVLRNFPGSLEGRVKLHITRECYSLGMRTLGALLHLANESLDDLRQYIGSIINERTGLSDSELANHTDRAIIWLTIVGAWGSIKRISYAVGHPDLTPTYEKVLEGSGTLATRIIDIAIKLDHADGIPELELRRLRPVVRKNHFAYTVVRDLVGDFLYLYRTDYPMMQRLAAMWDIEITGPKHLLNRDKKT